jgi:hypothetical protein
MKNVTLHIGDSIIEIHNSWQGKETILVDGQKVSEKNSMSGAYHSFTILDNGKEKLVELSTKLNLSGVFFSLYVDKKPIVELPERNTNLNLFWLTIGATMVTILLLVLFQ